MSPFRDDDGDRRRDRDEEGEKKSWREIDQRRDRSRHVTGPKAPRQTPFQKKREASENKAALNQLFGDKAPDKEEMAALKAIREAKEKKAFVAALAAYEQQYGLPKDWDTCFRLLDHPETRVVLAALEQLRLKAPHRLAEERELLKGHLKILALTTREAEVEEGAQALLAAL